MGSTAANFLKENLPALLHRHLTQTRESSLQMDLVLRQVITSLSHPLLFSPLTIISPLFVVLKTSLPSNDGIVSDSDALS